MTPRTRFLSRLIGLYSILIAVAMATHRQATLDAVAAILHSASMMLILGVVTLAAGLAMLLGHNLWSGGPVTVLVTIVGWLTLLKGAVFLLLPPEAEAAFFLNTLHYEQLFYLYLSISFTIGVFLASGGFAPSPRSGNLPLVMGHQIRRDNCPSDLPHAVNVPQPRAHHSFRRS